MAFLFIPNIVNTLLFILFHTKQFAFYHFCLASTIPRTLIFELYEVNTQHLKNILRLQI
jgi:hypothetical protein